VRVVGGSKRGLGRWRTDWREPEPAVLASCDLTRTEDRVVVDCSTALVLLVVGRRVEHQFGARCDVDAAPTLQLQSQLLANRDVTRPIHTLEKREE